MSAIYLHNWAAGGFEEMRNDFKRDPWLDLSGLQPTSIAEPDFQDIEVLLASYGNECYEGDAFVLFRKNGQLYEVNGSHCSCYGLEGQWDPEETSIEVLEHRLTEGELGRHGYYEDSQGFAVELQQVLNSLKQEQK